MDEKTTEKTTETTVESPAVPDHREEHRLPKESEKTVVEKTTETVSE